MLFYFFTESCRSSTASWVLWQAVNSKHNTGTNSSRETSEKEFRFLTARTFSVWGWKVQMSSQKSLSLCGDLLSERSRGESGHHWTLIPQNMNWKWGKLQKLYILTSVLFKKMSLIFCICSPEKRLTQSAAGWEEISRTKMLENN